MKKFLKKVATGPKGNEDLSYEESYNMMMQLLSGDVSDVEKASFLVGWRLKPETNEEYKGALKALLEKVKRKPLEHSFELGFPFDGKNNSPYLFPLTGKLLKTEGIDLVVCGDEKIPAKDGVTVKMLHQQLVLMPYDWQYHYFDRHECLQEMSDLSTMRNRIGLRTALNTLEKFTLAAESSFGASGVFHKPYVEKYSAIFQDHLKRFLLVSGNEGGPEVTKKSRCWIVGKEGREEIILDPQEFGITPFDQDEEFTLERQVSLLQNVPRNMWLLAALNAALYLHVIKPETKLNKNYEIFLERIPKTT